MATVHDVMPPFQLFQPASVDDALELLAARGEEAWVMAGGMDSFDWLKDRTKRTSVVVDLSQIDALRGVREHAGGLEIGALTALVDVAEHSAIRERYRILGEAAGLVASPQIRNQATLGGNVSQDARCWYYRRGWSCYRAGGSTCYADTPTAVNREHAILHRRVDLEEWRTCRQGALGTAQRVDLGPGCGDEIGSQLDGARARRPRGVRGRGRHEGGADEQGDDGDGQGPPGATDARHGIPPEFGHWGERRGFRIGHQSRLEWRGARILLLRPARGQSGTGRAAARARSTGAAAISPAQR